MSEPTPHRRLRRSVWLALLALWLQVLAPVLHDAAMASAGAAGFDPAVQHCASPETQPDNPASPDKAPAHQMTACAAACQAFHGGGGFPPPAAPATAVGRFVAAAYQTASDSPVSRRWSRTSQQPRAPPALA